MRGGFKRRTGFPPPPVRSRRLSPSRQRFRVPAMLTCSANSRTRTMCTILAHVATRIRYPKAPVHNGGGLVVKGQKKSGVSSRRTKTDKVAPARRLEPATAGGADEPRKKVERSAPKHTDILVLRSLRIFDVLCNLASLSGTVTHVMLLTPLPYIAVHIKKPRIVRLETRYWPTSIIGRVSRPCVLPQQILALTEVPAG